MVYNLAKTVNHAECCDLHMEASILDIRNVLQVLYVEADHVGANFDSMDELTESLLALALLE